MSFNGLPPEIGPGKMLDSGAEAKGVAILGQWDDTPSGQYIWPLVQ